MAHPVAVLAERDLSPKEAARELGVSVRIVQRACAAGRLGYRPSGSPKGHWRISRAELDRFRRVSPLNAA